LVVPEGVKVCVPHRPKAYAAEKIGETGAMKKQFWTGLIVGIVISGIVGGTAAISMVGKKAVVEPSDFEAYVINHLKNLRIPEAAPPATPIEMTDENLLQGGEHYNHNCAACHDLEGDADSELARAFYPPVADLTAQHVQSYSDRQLKWIVANGIRFTGMPGWMGLIDEMSQWRIVYYMRVLADPEKAQKYEAMLKERGKWGVDAPDAGEDHHAEPTAMHPENVHDGPPGGGRETETSQGGEQHL